MIWTEYNFFAFLAAAALSYFDTPERPYVGTIMTGTFEPGECPKLSLVPRRYAYA